MRPFNATGVLFYALVVFWVALVLAGMIAGWPYVGRPYAGVTLPGYGGLSLLLLALANLVSGEVWRAGAEPIQRRRQPAAYWIGQAVLAVAGTLLLTIAILGWMGLKG